MTIDDDAAEVSRLDRPIDPDAAAADRIEMHMLDVFDEMSSVVVETDEFVVADAIEPTIDRRAVGRTRHRWLAVAAALLVAVAISAVVVQSGDEDVDQEVDVVSDEDASEVHESVSELCRTAVPAFGAAFDTFAANILDAEQNKPLIDARTDLIVAIRTVSEGWPTRYREMISDELEAATLSNASALEFIGGPSDLVLYHHGRSQEMLERMLSNPALPGAENCRAERVAWRPGG